MIWMQVVYASQRRRRRCWCTIGVLVVQSSRVLLQVKVPAESLVTQITGEGLGRRVGVHVKGQVIQLKKAPGQPQAWPPLHRGLGGRTSWGTLFEP